ncbi:hypothetical protein BO70DRAFT_151961 [Aspergillus heteromorphus CBS 117.55]|uniref:Uncharacterized protein n=1 Tax=Aspergillus heteromorphus CBS 117.55 TaxID=1448321 RepID=A0A317V4T9_9EURO|nr:uncharacterized protein BO70DRAFT_151961 [Aspergillus heteromorphus CBS 117.55]PWY68659.1 hypothetical protein BO70DRAFT_151961 [Aspergillus heteromorphus CBS 117.55]
MFTRLLKLVANSSHRGDNEGLYLLIPSRVRPIQLASHTLCGADFGGGRRRWRPEVSERRWPDPRASYKILASLTAKEVDALQASCDGCSPPDGSGSWSILFLLAGKNTPNASNSSYFIQTNTSPGMHTQAIHPCSMQLEKNVGFALEENIGSLAFTQTITPRSVFSNLFSLKYLQGH